jgi:hypothetical protein
MTTPSTDRQRLKQARGVIHEGRPDKGSSNAVYAAYVAVIASLVYGIPAVHAFFAFVDPAWTAQHLTGWQGVLVLGGAGVGLLLLAYRLGSVRGPVVPDLPYLDQVAGSAIDRALVLRRWWLFSLFGCVLAGLLGGGVVGAGMALANVASFAVLVPTVLVGTAVGLGLAGAWLWGQVRSWPTGDRGPGVLLRPRRALRALHVVGLRTQSARAVTVGGAVLAGDLRAARLDVAPPTTRARHTRLRARGPVAIVVARDALGLRRSPGALVVGAVLALVGCWALGQATSPGVPSMVAFAGTLASYLGFGAWAEGLRLQGDNAGTPPLLGLPFRIEALAHVVAPSALYAASSVLVGTWLVVVAHAGPAAVWWPLLTTGLLAGAHLMAAFRGLPPLSLFAPGSAVASVTFWYSRPLLLTLVGGVASTALLVRTGVENGVPAVLLFAWLALTLGRRRVRLLDEAHRA